MSMAVPWPAVSPGPSTRIINHPGEFPYVTTACLCLHFVNQGPYRTSRFPKHPIPADECID